jgi:hypothetical protein
LCLRNLDTSNLDEVEVEIRNTGASQALSSRQDRQGNQLYHLRPFCFVRAYSLFEEQGNFLDVINKDRECDRFEAWQQGFTPKEHLEMINLQEERKAREAFAREEREWKREEREVWEKARREDLKWKADQDAASRKQFRNEMIVLVTCALFAAFASMAGSIIQAWATWQTSHP